RSTRTANCARSPARTACTSSASGFKNGRPPSTPCLGRGAPGLLAPAPPETFGTSPRVLRLEPLAFGRPLAALRPGRLSAAWRRHRGLLYFVVRSCRGKVCCNNLSFWTRILWISVQYYEASDPYSVHWHTP